MVTIQNQTNKRIRIQDGTTGIVSILLPKYSIQILGNDVVLLPYRVAK